MRVPASETIVVKPELIRLVRRDDSKKWQAHYKLENLKTWFRRSTDTADLKEASKIAERMCPLPKYTAFLSRQQRPVGGW